MVQKGPHRLRLESYVRGVDVGGIVTASQGYRAYVMALQMAAEALNDAAKVINGQNGTGGSLSSVSFQHASAALGRSSTNMMDNSDLVGPAAPAVGTSAVTVAEMQKMLAGMKDVPDDPPPSDPTTAGTDEGIKAEAQRQSQVNANAQAMAEQEAQAAAATKKMDDDYATAVEEMKKIHGIPDPPPPSGAGGSPQGPSGGGGGVFHPAGTDSVFGVGDDGGGGGNDDGGGDDGGGDGDDGYGDGGDGGTYDGDPAVEDPTYLPDDTSSPGDPDDGVLAPTGSPFSGVTGQSNAAADSVGGGGGLSGAATAGIIGGAAAVGGIGAVLGKSLAAKGFSVPGLSGQAGRIGGTSRTAGSAVTGRSGAAGRSAGSGAAGSGTRGSGARAAGKAGAGAGAGRGAAGTKAGGKGAAGGRGAAGRGAGAGAAGGRGGKKDRAKGSVWEQVEDGDHWIDDEGAGDSVIS